MGSIFTLLRAYRYELIAFLTGASVMMLEIVGARLIAPHFGTSMYVWTAMIGVILASLAFGFWYGGRLADTSLSKRTLSLILTVAAVVVLFATIIQSTVLDWVAGTTADLRLGALSAALVLFGPPSVLIGMIGPHLAKIRVTSLASTGRSIGRLEAMSTVGSIAGTFLSGFWLLAYFGAQSLAIGLAIVLVITSFLADKRGWLGFRLAVLLAGVLLLTAPASLPPNVLADVDTSYARYKVSAHVVDGQEIRFLSTDSQATQSAAYANDPLGLVFDYNKRFMGIAESYGNPEKVLVIGGGTHTFPSALVNTDQDIHVDVVEIDPALDTLAAKYFGYVPDERLNIIHTDGRIYLNRSSAQYDLIVVDAFSSRTPPFHLASQQAVEKMASSLRDDGVVAVNIVADYQRNHEYLRVMKATYAAEFSNVEIFQASPGAPLASVQNFVLVATNDGMRLREAAPNFISAPLPVTPEDWVFTDDYAPIERLNPNY